MATNNNCEGCRDLLRYLETHEGIGTGPHCTLFNDDGDCPCTICVIKSMCSGGRLCENFSIWWHDQGVYNNVKK